MIKIVNIGMNHVSAPVELRECLARDPENSSLALAEMRKSEFIKEGLFLSTCNRVEALYTTEQPDKAKIEIISLMSKLGDVSQEKFLTNLYEFNDSDAVRHIFRVASSLDSMVVGEPQIMGQIKEAYSLAVQKEKTAGVVLNRLMHKTFQVAKRVRTETGISEAAVSISYAAVELAKKIFYDLSGRMILLIGAGEMAELAARHLMNHGMDRLVVANRSFDNAVRVADVCNGKPILFEEIGEYLRETDIVIASTGSPECVVTYDQVKQVLRKRRNRSLFFIDIAVPRDIDPRIHKLGNVYVYDIDELKEVIKENTAQRKQEAIKAERIIDEEVIRFEKWRKTLSVVPTIVSLKDKVEKIRKAEVKKSLANLRGLTLSQKDVIETLTISLAHKIINDPILILKGKSTRSSKETFLDLVKTLFNLD